MDTIVACDVIDNIDVKWNWLKNEYSVVSDNGIWKCLGNLVEIYTELCGDVTFKHTALGIVATIWFRPYKNPSERLFASHLESVNAYRHV